jgi:dTDP-4-dehydrorhamnose reductase
VTNPDSIRRAAVGHDAVVNTAYVQSGPLARATNVDGAANAATVCNNLGIHLLHISSDAVFSGNEDSYPESAPCDPIAGYQYGEQKAEAERRVHDLCPRATILRTSLLYSSDGSGALNRAVRESLSPASTAVYFTDEFRCPAHVDDVAAAAVASLGLPELAVVHAAGAELLSRRETSVRLAGLMGLDSSRIRAGTAESLDLPRPRRIHLDSSLARIRLGWSPGSL